LTVGFLAISRKRRSSNDRSVAARQPRRDAFGVAEVLGGVERCGVLFNQVVDLVGTDAGQHDLAAAQQAGQVLAVHLEEGRLHVEAGLGPGEGHGDVSELVLRHAVSAS
jgi:hypothetical protein